MQKVGPQSSATENNASFQTTPTSSNFQDTDREQYQKPNATRGIDITSDRKETIAGIEIRYDGLNKSDLEPYGVRFFKGPDGSLKLQVPGDSFDVDSNTNFITVSIDKSGSLHIDVVDREKDGAINSRGLTVAKDRTVTVGDAKITQVREIPFSIPQDKKDEIFYNGLKEAEKSLQSQFPGSQLRVEASGARVKDFQRQSINPIEYQKITFIDKNGNETELGNVLPEKVHLRTLKSSEELKAEILKRAEEILKFRVTDSRPVPQQTEPFRFKVIGAPIEGPKEVVVNPQENRELYKKVQELIAVGCEVTPRYDGKAGSALTIRDRNENYFARAEGSNLYKPTEKEYLNILEKAVNKALYKPEFGYRVRFEDGLSLVDLMRNKIQLINDRNDPLLSKVEFSQTSAHSGPYRMLFNNEPITEDITIRKGANGGLEFVIGNKGGSVEIISCNKDGHLIGQIKNDKFEPTVIDAR